MANIRDVAKKAGVSVTTVSRVINEHPYVKQEKRLAVLEAMEECGYVKNINAVHLSKGTTGMIGIVLPFIDHPYFSSLLNGLAHEARVHQKKLVLFQTDYEIDHELEALELLRQKQLDGLIFCSRECNWSVIEAYQSYGTIVMCEKMDERISYTFVDHYRIFQEALGYLEKKGYERIGYCIGRRSGSNSLARETAYRDFLVGKGQPFREEWIFDGCYDLEDGDSVVQQLQDLEKKPDALLVTSDHVAAGIMSAAGKRGIRIPEDLAVIGFDNHPIARMLSITTFDLPLEEMGRNLFRQVLSSDVSSTEISATLVERKTV
ncbi:LacI family DNA-binding transcriptional regulator [Jeotgalibacillus aurantiacus]|uniref:LacI family DNA-binding transcriptional regulator n=1 Tax=Jeotgalibacillus aurantiacus TaxID=2763266 RepID=UPI001D0AB946|nr:LacI family DNA-binding transcriptional regulator [Jeotgalibacillus aurantiacus]